MSESAAYRHDSRMKNESTVQRLAAELRLGGTAKIAGGKVLRGYSPTYMEIDGVPVEVPRSRPTEQPAVIVTRPDGSVSMYVVSTVERARFLLHDAERLVKS